MTQMSVQVSSLSATHDIALIVAASSDTSRCSYCVHIHHTTFTQLRKMYLDSGMKSLSKFNQLYLRTEMSGCREVPVTGKICFAVKHDLAKFLQCNND